MPLLTRRQFLKGVAGGACAIALSRIPLEPIWDLFGEEKAFAGVPELSQVEAKYYQRLPHQEVECQLCPRRCRVGDLERGYCGVRENRGGIYYTLVHSRPAALNIDPIEKKPFFHFLPSTMAFSLGTAGCNLQCKFCQNWEISQVRPEQIDHFDLPPEAAAAKAKDAGCASIAYTYTEPIVFFESMFDTAVRARHRGVKSVVVTGGHINPEPLADLLAVVDAVKIDLKGFTQEFYKEYVRGELQPVLDAIRAVARSKVWLEIVYLVIPTLNDRLDLIREMARWVRNEAGDHVPVHFSRFMPMYLVKNLPPTPVSTLEAARETALAEGLRFVYVGNVPGHKGETTFCPGCGQAAVRRVGYRVEAVRLKGGRCDKCGTSIPGIWA